MGEGARLRRRAGAALAVASTVLAGCSKTTPPASTPAPDPQVASASHPGGDGITRRDATISVDWENPGVRWRTVLSMTFGPGDAQLGMRRYRGQEPIVPSAFAVTPEGFAIMDPAKRRVILVDEDGRVLQRWTGLAEQASDLVWDQSGDRLVAIDHEPDGRLAELRPDGSVVKAEASPYPVFRLVSTPTGVLALGAGDARLTSDLYQRVPDPIGPLTDPTRDLAISSSETLRIEPRTRSGGSWTVARRGHWGLRLDFRGRHGPRDIVAPLREDLAIDGSRLVLATLGGSFVADDSLTRRLVVAEVDLKSGRLVSRQQVATCGLRQDANVVSLITAYDGETYQLCLSPDHLEIRRRSE